MRASRVRRGAASAASWLFENPSCHARGFWKIGRAARLIFLRAAGFRPLHLLHELAHLALCCAVAPSDRTIDAPRPPDRPTPPRIHCRDFGELLPARSPRHGCREIFWRSFELGLGMGTRWDSAPPPGTPADQHPPPPLPRSETPPSTPYPYPGRRSDLLSALRDGHQRRRVAAIGDRLTPNGMFPSAESHALAGRPSSLSASSLSAR